MLCFRVVFWIIVLCVLMIPGFFLAGLVGRLAGFRPGPKSGQAEAVFGWIGIVVLSGMMLGICAVGGLIDWVVTTAGERMPNMPPPGQFQQPPPFPRPINPPPPQWPTPKPIPADWDEAKMQATYLSDLTEFDAQVGFGSFGKKGKLGYQVVYGDSVQVNGKKSPQALSLHPPAFGASRVKYRLQRDFKLFKASVAYSDADHALDHVFSTATFKVLGDGVFLWASRPIAKGRIDHARLSVEGVEVLELQVHCPGGQGNVRAVWLEPQVLK